MITDFVTAVHTTLATPSDQWFIGDYHRGTNGAPPRYVWVPTQDRIGGPLEGSAFASRTPRNLFTRYAGIECHVWGTTLPATEAMAHAIVAGIYAQLGALSYEAIDGIRWPPEAMNSDGFLAIVSLSLPIPITAAPIETVGTATFETIECDDTPPATPDGYVECCEEIDP